MLKLFLAGSLAFGTALQAQTTGQLTFDVSSVRLHPPNAPSGGWSAGPGQIRVINTNLTFLIADAWGLRPDQVLGQPAWADDEHWDVEAKMTEADAATLKAMTFEDREHSNQVLLADRFHLKAHLETRQRPIFHLVPAKGGIKLKMLPPLSEGGKPEGPLTAGKFMVPSGGIVMRGLDDGANEFVGHRIGMKALLGNVAANFRQTVIDKTGIAPDASFDVTLRFAPDQGPSVTARTDAPPLPEALEQQLGLHLEATRGAVQVIVVDHVERPTPN